MAATVLQLKKSATKPRKAPERLPVARALTVGPAPHLTLDHGRGPYAERIRCMRVRWSIERIAKVGRLLEAGEYTAAEAIERGFPPTVAEKRVREREERMALA
jgi:hypothetical protein